MDQTTIPMPKDEDLRGQKGLFTLLRFLSELTIAFKKKHDTRLKALEERLDALERAVKSQ